jgi:hypothetical protein
MTAILIPDVTPEPPAGRPRAGYTGDPLAGTATRRPRRVTTPVVPTDCPTCLSAGSVRRGICDICGTATVE